MRLIRFSTALPLALLAAPLLHAQFSAPTITTTSPLPSATAGKAYSQTFVVAGGVSPFHWIAGTGVPAGLTMGNTTGILSGTPTTAGNFTFGVQVTDSNGLLNAATFTLAVNPAPLQILTASPLSSGQTGAAYSQPLSAGGGAPPYKWSVSSGNTDGLTLNATSGVLSGTPQAAGTFTFIAAVTDSANKIATQSLSLTVTPPPLVITAGAALPGGTVGTPYDQIFSVTVSGGVAPYTWSLTSGSVPGLTFHAATVELSGTPTTAGSYTLTLQVADSAGASGTRNFSLTIAAAALTITTGRQLPAASLNTAYSQTLAATGGVPPYTWTANGLPSGLTINSGTGVISGTPVAAGNFAPVITVSDSALTTYRDNFGLSVQLPALPSISLSGLPASSTAAQQFALAVAITAAYSAPINGQVTLTFQPASGPADSTIQFSTGGQTANFTIPAGSTSATFTGSNGLPATQLMIQTGTAAGSIAVALSNITTAGVNVTPTPAPSISTQIAAAAPVISKVQVIRNADSASGCQQGQICVEITGYSTDRQVSVATFNFSATAGQTLQSSAGSIPVTVASTFSTWFGTSTMGSQFIFVQPFTVTGNPADVVCTSVVLTNPVGSTTATVNQ